MIAVGFRDLLHQSVGAEQANQARDPLAFLGLVQGRLVGPQAFAQVAVAEPVQRDCVSDSAETRKAAADRLQQVSSGLGQRVQGAGRATVERGPLANFLRRLTEGGGRLDGGQSLEVALVALLADRHQRRGATAVQIGHALAKREPVRALGKSAAASFCSLSPAIGTAIGVDSTAGERAGVRGPYRPLQAPHHNPGLLNRRCFCRMICERSTIPSHRIEQPLLHRVAIATGQLLNLCESVLQTIQVCVW